MSEQSLSESGSELPHALVEVSHRQTALEIRGPQAALLLNAGCPLDLEPGAFPVGVPRSEAAEQAEFPLSVVAPTTAGGPLMVDRQRGSPAACGCPPAVSGELKTVCRPGLDAGATRYESAQLKGCGDRVYGRTW